MGNSNIGNDGITAIARSLSNSSVMLLDVTRCGISFIGVKLLAAALTSNHNIRTLWLWNNPVTVDGARLIMTSAVDSGVCEDVSIDYVYECDDKVKKMIAILNDRRQGVRKLY